MSKIISIIPARGGSKGVPKKNIKIIGGKPLIVYTIEQSIKSDLIDDTYVSTDSDEIASISRRAGAKIIYRPDILSNDTCSSEDVILDALEQISEIEGYQPELVVFLQCTSPIRNVDDIDNAINLLIQRQADSLLSVVDSHRFIWQESDNKPDSINYDYSKRPRRQDLNPQYCENGSIYIFTPKKFIKNKNRLHGKIVLYKMSPESGYEIDDYMDLHIIESIFKYKEQL